MSLPAKVSGSNPPRGHRALSQFEKIALGRRVIQDEAAALLRLADHLPAALHEAADMICDCSGAVIVIGIGKAGWVGQKLSATLASTGTRSHFLHPAEAIHGDLGRIGHDDIVILLSNSGETEEMTRLLPTVQRLAAGSIAITAHRRSTMAKAASLVLDYGVVEEACPLGLAPTTSTIVMMAVGDALALVASQLKGFGAEDFGQFHPGGSLGRKLSLVDDIMRPLAQCRVAQVTETVREIYIRLAGPDRRSGAILLVDDTQRLCGIFTDSDLARLLERKLDRALDACIERVMTCAPTTVTAGSRVQSAVELLANRNLSELPVVDAHGKPVGMIDVTDLIAWLPDRTDR